MKTTLTFNQFCDGFPANRQNTFSYNGKKALYNYLLDLEKETGEEIEFDPVAFCCEFAEYANINEYLDDYNTDIKKEDCLDEEEYKEKIKDTIKDETTFIPINDNSFIIQQY